MSTRAGDNSVPPMTSAPVADGPWRVSTIGLLGGMSFESTALYYRLINEDVRRRLGGVHSARVLLHSFDFEEVIALQRAGDWPGAAALLG